MRRSEFHRAAADEFGGRASSLLADLMLPSLQNMTSDEAIDAGVPPREVWLALCNEADVPESSRYGVGRLDPRER